MSNTVARAAAKSRGRTAPAQHAGRRQVVLASAQVELLQVQVIGSDGEEKSVLDYRCGPDVFWGKSMDDIFSLERRKTAPGWLRTGLAELPATRRFLADGTAMAEVNSLSPAQPEPPEIQQG